MKSNEFLHLGIHFFIFYFHAIDKFILEMNSSDKAIHSIRMQLLNWFYSTKQNSNDFRVLTDLQRKKSDDKSLMNFLLDR